MNQIKLIYFAPGNPEILSTVFPNKSKLCQTSINSFYLLYFCSLIEVSQIGPKPNCAWLKAQSRNTIMPKKSESECWRSPTAVSICELPLALPFPPQHFVYRYIISALLIYNRLCVWILLFGLLLGPIFRRECGYESRPQSGQLIAHSL